MWKYIKRIIDDIAIGVIATVMAGTFIACSFDPPTILDGQPPSPDVDFNDEKWLPEEVNIIMQTAALKTPTEEQAWPVQNGTSNTGDFESHHGYMCTEADRVFTKNKSGEDLIGIRMRGSRAFLSPKDNAMVMLNGWRVKYLNRDHDVKALGVSLHSIRQAGSRLNWEVSMALADQDGNDAIEACYFYTAVMWNRDTPQGVDAYVVQNDADHKMTFIHPQSKNGGLRTLSGEFDAHLAKAIVPRGYGFIFAGLNDHNLLQVAFDLDTNVWTNQDTISWDSSLIFKDNNAPSFHGATMVSVMGNPGVEMIRSSLPLTPRTPNQCPNKPEPAYRTERKSVPGLRFDHAVPVLAGFNIGDACNDQNLSEAGAWISSWYYEKEGETGTLHYTVKSVFRDKNDHPGSRAPSYKVNILGFHHNQETESYVAITSQACCGWSGQYLGVDPNTGEVGMYAEESGNTKWRYNLQNNVLRLQTLVSGPFSEWYLDISTTSGTVKLLNRDGHSGTKWRQEDESGISRLTSLASGTYNGQYLSLSTTSGTLRMHKSPNHSGAKWQFEHHP